MARIMRKMDLLPTEKVVIQDAESLTAGFVGQTAGKVTEFLKDAQGGVLFIDEAHRLVGGADAFKKEAIGTLMTAITSDTYKNKILIVLAGYTEPLDKFLQSDPGLTRRFPVRIEFTDIDAKKALECFRVKLTATSFRLCVGGEVAVHDLFVDLIGRKGWSNLGDVDFVVSELVKRAKYRIYKPLVDLDAGTRPGGAASVDEMQRIRQDVAKTLLEISPGDITAVRTYMLSTRQHATKYVGEDEMEYPTADQTSQARARAFISPPGQVEVASPPQADQRDAEEAQADDDDDDAGGGGGDTGIVRDCQLLADFDAVLGLTEEERGELMKTPEGRRRLADKLAGCTGETAEALRRSLCDGNESAATDDVMARLAALQSRADEAFSRAHAAENSKKMQAGQEQADNEARARQLQNLQRVVEAIADEEEKQREQARLAALQRQQEEALRKAAEAERVRNSELAKMRRLAERGPCPQGYAWHKVNGGYRCQGGSHYLSDADFANL